MAVLAHGRHVADVVPSGDIERLRETIEVLSDNDLLRDVHAGLDDLRPGRVVRPMTWLRTWSDAAQRESSQWYLVVFTASARCGLNRLPAAAAVALFEHLSEPVAGTRTG